MSRGHAYLVTIATSVALLLSACGAPSPTAVDAPAAAPGDRVRNGTAEGAAKGGTLNLLGAGDVDYLDPNVTYYSAGYVVSRLYSRQLFAVSADPATKNAVVPDLAEQRPTPENGGVAADGKTYTITIRAGAQWSTSPARQVTAAD